MVHSAVGVSMCVLTDVNRFGLKHLPNALIVIGCDRRSRYCPVLFSSWRVHPVEVNGFNVFSPGGD
jgi:hypothetical protein